MEELTRKLIKAGAITVDSSGTKRFDLDKALTVPEAREKLENMFSTDEYATPPAQEE